MSQAWWSLDAAEDPGGRRFLESVENDICAKPAGSGQRGPEARQAKLPFQAVEPPDISLGTGVGQTRKRNYKTCTLGLRQTKLSLGIPWKIRSL